MKQYLSIIFLISIADIHTFTVKTGQSSSSPDSSLSSGVSSLSVGSSQVIQQSSVNQGGISALSTQSNSQQTTPTVVKTWSVTLASNNAPTIYSDPKFSATQTVLYGLSQSVNALVKTFKIVQQQNSKIIWSVTSNAMVSQSSSQADTTTASNFVAYDYTHTFTLFQQYISGSTGSYLSVFQDLSGIYQNLYPAFTAYMQNNGQSVSPQSEAYFAMYPFQSNSYLLSVVQSIANVMIQYLTSRAALISASNYTDNNGAGDLFGSKGAFTYCDTVMSSLQNVISSSFSAISNIQGVASSDLNNLQLNYQTIFNLYVQQKNTLVLKTVSNLLKTLVQKNPSNLVSSQTSNVPVSTMLLENYVTDAMSAIQYLNQIGMNPSIGGYASLDDLSKDIQTMIANLYVFNSKILLVNIEQSAKSNNSLPYSITDKDQVAFQITILKALDLFQQMLTQAATHVANSGDSNLYALYIGQVTMATTIIASWNNGISAYGIQSYANALNYFNSILNTAQQLNLNNVAAYVITIIQKINLEYEKTLFELYMQYPTYLSSFGAYISHAITADVSTYESDQALWSTLWYPQSSPIQSADRSSSVYQGLYPLCNSALQTMQSVLNSVQLNQLVVSDTQIVQLQNAVQVLTPLVTGLKEMLVQGSLFSDKQPADNNMYVNYYTPSGYREAYVQYQLIIKSFDAVDNAMAKYSGVNPYVPLQELLASQKITNFGTLARLHYARWAYSMGMYAMQYASSKNCLTDKQCIVYQSTSYQYALCALIDAQRLYASLGYTSLASSIQAKISTLKQYAAGLVTTANALATSRVTSGTSPDKAYYDALYYLQIAASLDSKTYGTQYITALQNLIQKESSNAFSRTVPSLYCAYLAYQGYVWSIFTQDSNGQSSYKSQISSSLLTANTQITGLQNQIKSLQNPTNSTLAGAITIANQLQDIQSTLQNFSLDQIYQQGILNSANKNFVQMSDTSESGSTITNVTSTFLDGTSLVLPNSTYILAQLYIQQANQIVNQIQTSVTKNQYPQGFNDLFTQAIDIYKNAITCYTTLSLTDNVISTEKLLSQLVALYYYSLIIPSDIVTAALGGKVISSASTTTSTKSSRFAVKVTNGLNASTNAITQNSSSVSSESTFIQPLYLMRYYEQNLSALKTLADQNVTLAQQQNNQVLITNAIANQATYTSIFTAAQKLVGSKDTSAIINEVVIPLYKETLLANGYQNPFKTLDEQVQVYTQQLQGMVTIGSTIGGVPCILSCIVSQRKNSDGTTSLLLQSYNLPVSAVPQFTGDSTSALIVYSQYQQFFQQTTQSITMANGVYFPIPNTTSYAAAQKLINQTYIAAVNEFSPYITGLLAPFKTLSNPTQTRFSDYVQTYSSINNVYQEIFAYYSALDQLQQSSGIVSSDVNALYVSKFQEYGDSLSNFLIGDPTDPEYISRVIQASMGYLMATNYTSDLSIKSIVYKKAGDVYKYAGNSAYNYQINIPSGHGYPSARANNFPTSVSDGSTLIFYGYQQAQGYYQQALQNYRQSYALTHNNASKGEILDSNIYTYWTLYIIAGLKYALQNVALFGRNAFVPLSDSIRCDFSPIFIALQASAQNGGSTSALQGMAGVTGTGGFIANPYAQSQYSSMKNALLQALVYLSGVVNSSNLYAQASGVVSSMGSTNIKSKKLLGTTYLSACAQCFPDLTALSGKNSVPISSYSSNPETLDIGTSLSNNQIYALLHADGYMKWNSIVIDALCGSGQNLGSLLKNSDNLIALSLYVSQLSGIIRTIYGNAFLPQLVANNTDISTAQQNMLVNVSGYVG